MTSREAFGDFSPKLAELTDDFLIGGIWERPGLSLRDRSMITVAILTALDRGTALAGHLERAVQNGLTKEEIIEMMIHVGFYAGWPNGIGGTIAAKKLFAELEENPPG